LHLSGRPGSILGFDPKPLPGLVLLFRIRDGRQSIRKGIVMVERVFNFSPGPAMLPTPVIEETGKTLLSVGSLGAGVMEISHRGKEFGAIIDSARANIRTLLGIGDDYDVLFLQGGASLQFIMAPMNLLLPGRTADYILTGTWSKKALKEAKLVGKTHVAATTEPENFSRLPRPDEIELSDNPIYAHITTNNTIFGTQWPTEPDTGTVPLVADASSDILSRPIDLKRYGMIYAGAQKNLGPSGVVLVVIRRDLLERIPDTLPSMLSYKIHAGEKSLYNTPPTISIYILNLVTKWVIAEGGLEEMTRRANLRAKLLYDRIDKTGFYRGTAAKDSRSKMNVTFRLPSEELEAEFVKQAATQKLYALKGHRSVGGIRASIYNAMPVAGVELLVSFMDEFERTHG
jgi:phosphoserine aminotransferase